MYYPITGYAKRIKKKLAVQIRSENGEKTDKYRNVKQNAIICVQM